MNRYFKPIGFIMIVAAIVATIIYLEGFQGLLPSQDSARSQDSGYALVGIQGWINSNPLTLQSLRGKVVLIDFWTYTCINCIRTFPYLKAWYEKYSPDGFVIIGVHSPEFGFEKNIDNVREATQRFGLKYPIAIDNDHQTFNAFGNRFWPHKYLFDSKGNLRYDHIGEGGYVETEQQIRKLLAENGVNVSNMPLEGEQKYDNSSLGSARAGITGELYATRDIVNVEGFNNEGKKAGYLDDGKHPLEGIYLQGEWLTEKDDMLYTGNGNGYFLIAYKGRSATPVMGTPSMQRLIGVVFLDGKPIPRELAGPDLKFDSNGNSIVDISGPPRLYSFVNTNVPFGSHELKVEADAGLGIWSVTFGG